MYINPFLLGVLGTVTVEVLAIIILIIVLIMKERKH